MSAAVASLSVALGVGQFLIVDGRLTTARAQVHFKKRVGTNAQYRGSAAGDDKEAGLARRVGAGEMRLSALACLTRPRGGDPSDRSV
jgi:hypothetical protein